MFQFKEGFYADIRIEDRFTTNISIKNGQLEEYNVTTLKKAFLRVFDGEMWYYSSTTDTDNIQKELDSLYGYAKANPNIEEHPIVKRYEVNKDELYQFASCSVRDISAEEKMAKLTSLDALLASEHMKMRRALYLDRNSKFEFYSSKGASVRYDYQTTGVSLVAALAHNGEQFADALQKSGVRFEEVIVSEQEIKSFLDELETYITTAKAIEPGAYPVILSPLATGVFAHESFGHKSEADFMVGDETMAKEWEIGKKVGSELLTIYETGTLKGCGYVPYDDEGTKAKMNYLIKDGRLAGRLHSSSTAAVMNEELTGNARAINCDYEPIVRMTNTMIQGGSSTFDELVAGIKHGFYVKTIKHGSGMSTFTIAPSVAYEIVDGKIADPVKIAVITGNVFETLGLIDGVGNDETALSFVTGGCGKMEQSGLPVGFGGPHIRVSKMNVQ
ncbi:MAG: TldD/PmbA family protein [Clostridia bacterium]|nr:TldD/PmbA family protein [Clostridia bacterium]